MIERTPVTDHGEVWIGGKPFRLASAPTWELGNIASRPVNQGAAGPNDHPHHSTSIQQDWSGGALVEKMNPAADTGRFRWSTLETQFTSGIALPPGVDVFSGPGGETVTPYVIGDFNGMFHAAWGTALYRFNANDETWTLVGNLPTSATGDGTVYREYSDTSTHKLVMFIPTATSYAVVDTTDVITNGETGSVWVLPAIDFSVWDNKIFMLASNGSLSYATKVAGMASDWTTITYIPDGSTPRRLVNYLDRSNNPVLMVVTDGSTFKLDFSNLILHEDDLDYPRHPDQGRAAAKHNGELFVSVGVGVQRYDNNTISSMGLDSRDGLPPEYRGYIVDMASAHNGLLALVRGLPADEPFEPTFGLHLSEGSGQAYLDASYTHNLLMIWNGFGWHYRWSGPGESPTNLGVSNVQEKYAAWWGSGGKLYRQRMTRTYFNPAFYDSAEFPLALSGTHESSWNDWNWVDQIKIMKAIEIKVGKMPAGSNVSAYYQIDDETQPWVYLGTVTAAGEYRWWVGQDPNEPWLRVTENFKDPNPKVKGVKHRRYRIRLTMTRGTDDRKTPVIEWHAVVARRWLRPQRNWRLVLDLTQKTKDWTIENQYEHIMNAAISQEPIVFGHQDHQYMAEIMLAQGPQNTGRDERAQVSLTLLETMELDHPDEPNVLTSEAV